MMISDEIEEPLISVIMPVYNAAYTVGRALLSLLDTSRKSEIEVIVVDDCSTDETRLIVAEIQQTASNVYLYSMPQNTGGPSAPRNYGIEKARGKYIAFLDDDDWVQADNLIKMAGYAKRNNYDFVKGYLIVENGQKQTIYNRLHEIPNDTQSAIRSIIAYQSSTNDFIVRREVLIKHRLRYEADIKIGEDTVFTIEMLAKCSTVAYCDMYFLHYTHDALDSTNLSSTHRCGDREINDQITAWERSEKAMSELSLSYFALRLYVGVRNLLLTIVRHSTGINEATFSRLHEFFLLTKSQVYGKMNLHIRYEELYMSILSGDYQKFLDASKQRLLIAGYDLKFILPVVPYFSESYKVRIDEWKGHASHDKKQSEECAEWADIIWCEWLLGNAVFYANLKNDNQRLVIRAHRFELDREFGTQVDFGKVDMVLTVSYYYFEAFSNRFSIPYEKIRLLSNYVEDDIYTCEKSPEARYNIGMIGILPARKGFHRGLELLKKLRSYDERFKLYIMGDRPEEVSWVNNNPDEKAYFDRCETYIEDNALLESLVYGGYRERSQLYGDIGYVLSLSDAEFPESFHLAPAEGVCAGSMGLILHWYGAEYIYPKEVILYSIDEIAQKILQASEDDAIFYENVRVLREFVLDNYCMQKFTKRIGQYLGQAF